jgi:sulfatase modifying factor 1
MNLIHRLATYVLVAFLLANLAAVNAHAVTIDWVTVGDPGNAADDTTYGAVADSFQIMKYEWTNSQYVQFLNAIDPDGVNPNDVYNANMGTSALSGISFDTNSSSGSKYAVRANMADKPVNLVSWWDAARVANWLHNGAQTYGSSDASASAPQNTGAYTLGTSTSSFPPGRNPGAQFYIPTEDQWYKAAYYKGGGTNAGYWDYATQSDTDPTKVTASETGIGSAGSTGNSANYGNTANWNGTLVGNVTTVGTNGGPGAYGTFDMNGNVFEWNDLTGDAGPGTTRGTRGGNLNLTVVSLQSDDYQLRATQYFSGEAGFRLAAPVPEPSTYAMALAGLACGGYTMWRRRKRA